MFEPCSVLENSGPSRPAPREGSGANGPNRNDACIAAVERDCLNSSRSPRRRWRGCRLALNDSGAPRTFPHETVLGRAIEFLAFRTYRLRQACLPFAFFQEAIERSAGQRLTFLPTALLAHVSCASAGPIAKAIIMAAKRIGFMAPSQMQMMLFWG